MLERLDFPVQYLKGIGPKRAKIFAKIGINTLSDLFYYFPRRYEDRTKFLSVSELKIGEIQTIKAEVLLKTQRQSLSRRSFSITEVVVGDKTGKIFCVWFNQPYLKDYFKPGEILILYGRVERYAGRLQMNSPEFEIISGTGDATLNTGRIVPIYSLPAGLTQRSFRQIMKLALDKYLGKTLDALAYDLRKRQRLLNLAKSILNIHFPQNLQLQKEAYLRLSFEEFFLFQIPLALRKMRKKEKVGIAHQTEGALVENFIASLPFALTRAQKEVINEIKKDMGSAQAMQRLLQGDVGSGKTVVATIASLIAIQGGYQVAFMVPTEILARQHYENISCQLSALRLGLGLTVSGVEPSVVSCQKKKIRIELLAGSIEQKQKEKIYQGLKEGRIDLVIGTHALLEESLEFKHLGLAVIDEQHKFGVGQRALLPKKAVNPDVLIMTATPIPRTLAITLYGDLDISVIRELPPGRRSVKTLFFPEEEKNSAYALAKAELTQGRQVYIVYPVIEESYALDIAGAKKMYEELKKGWFKEFRVGLIHGRLKQKEQDALMSDFKEKRIDLLVSTTVLEVGIDVANASCMIIEHVQRFGLAQLHQLRGRVGRGGLESFCILISDAKTEEAKARLEAMLKYTDGFRIAEEDLRIRGPGEFFGKRQHGLTELKIANPLTQMQLLKNAREEALRLIQADPALSLRQNAALRKKLWQRFPEYEKLLLVG